MTVLLPCPRTWRWQWAVLLHQFSEMYSLQTATVVLSVAPVHHPRFAFMDTCIRIPPAALLGGATHVADARFPLGPITNQLPVL